MVMGMVMGVELGMAMVMVMVMEKRIVMHHLCALIIRQKHGKFRI